MLTTVIAIGVAGGNSWGNPPQESTIIAASFEGFNNIGALVIEIETPQTILFEMKFEECIVFVQHCSYMISSRGTTPQWPKLVVKSTIHKQTQGQQTYPRPSKSTNASIRASRNVKCERLQ